MRRVLRLITLLFLVGNFWQPRAHAEGEAKALLDAVLDDDLQQVKSLLANGADVNAKQQYSGMTAIHLALSVAMAKLLIEAGADINVKDNMGATPLHIAAARGEHGYARGDSATAMVLIAAGADVNTQTADKTTPLHTAAGACNADVVEALLVAGAAVNAKANYDGELVTPLDIAPMCGMVGDEKTVAVLLAHGGDGDMYRELLEIEKGEDDSSTPLHRAVQNGTLADVAKLLAATADINAIDSNGNTPLHLAVQEAADNTWNDGAEKAKLLIEAGADVEVTNKLGWQAIHIAAQSMADEGVTALQVLIEAGADINAKLVKNGKVVTPLGLAYYYKIKKFLLANDAQ